MPLIPYDPESSNSRYAPQKNWSKILFRPDRKLQTTEIEELQDLLLGQINKAFDTLYDFYAVTSGCKIIIQGITSTSYVCILTEGQVYIDYENLTGTFVDIPSLNFTIPRDVKTTVGVRFDLNLDVDNPIHNNPSTGGAAFGSLGADRLLIRGVPVVHNDTNPILQNYFPLAVIKPKSPNFIANHPDVGDGYPDIYYYRNEELTQIFNETNVVNEIGRIVERTFHEMGGDFISEGYHISFNERNRILLVSPGVAYISGKRITHNYINGYELEYDIVTGPTITEDLIYLLYLTSKGEFDVLTFPIDTPYLPSPPRDSIVIGTMQWLGSKAQRGEPEYKLIPSNNRMPTIQEILLLEQEVEQNQKYLLEFALEMDKFVRRSNTSTRLEGLVVDSFSDLDQTDVSHPIFAASSLPSIQAISLPFVSFSKNNRTFIINNEENPSIRIAKKVNDLNEDVFYWYTVNGNEEKVIYQEQSSNFGLTTFQPTDEETIESIGKKLRLGGYVPSNNDTTLTAFSSPNVVYKSDQGTLINYTDPRVLSFVKNSINGQDQSTLDTTTETIDVNVPGINTLVQSQRIIVEAAGFPSLLDNIQLFLNDSTLTDITFIDGVGEPGSAFGTAKSSASGKLKFSFDLPTRTDRGVFSIRMIGQNYEASTQITISDPERNRLIRESTGRYLINIPPRYSLTASQVLQTFILSNPVMLSSVELKVNLDSVTGNLPLNADLLTVYITEMLTDSTPSDETLGIGTLYRTDFIENDWSRISFDRPIVIADTGKTYALVVNSSIENIELANYDFISPDQTTGFTGTTGNRFDGVMFLRNSQGRWERENTRDLTFRLNTYVPSTITSEANIVVRNTESYNILDLNLAAELKNRGQIRVEVEQDGQFIPVPSGVHFYNDDVNESRLKISTIGTPNTHPIIDLDDVLINLIKVRDEGTWKSINYEFVQPYTFVELTFEAFIPNNSTMEVYISSNKGLTWEELTSLDNSGNQEFLEDETVVNNLVPIVKYSYLKELSSFVPLDGNDVERTNLTIRIDMRVTDKTSIPFFKNLTALTY